MYIIWFEENRSGLVTNNFHYMTHMVKYYTLLGQTHLSQKMDVRGFGNKLFSCWMLNY